MLFTDDEGDRNMGAIFTFPGFMIFIVACLWGFFISFRIVVDNLGFIGGAVALFLAPITLAFAPWYEALANANWFPMLLVYGGGTVGLVFIGIGNALSGD